MTKKTQNLLQLLLSFKKMLPFSDFSQKIQSLTCLQMHVLGFIEKNPKVGMNDVAKFLSITPPSATSLIHQLVRSGVLTRVPDSGDRRKVLLLLTPKGKKNLEQARTCFAEHLQKIFSVLTEKEMNQFLSLMEKVLKSKSVH